MNERWVVLAVWPKFDMCFGLWWSRDAAEEFARRFERRCQRRNLETPLTFVMQMQAHGAAGIAIEEIEKAGFASKREKIA